MYLKEENDGFIFSLDATLAILVSLIALASVASVGSSLSTHEQFGRIRLQRTARDAVKILTLKGAFENAVLEMEAADYEEARKVLRENLKVALPEHTQFRLFIRDQISVYPSDNDKWDNLYENIKDRTVSNFLFTVPAKENYFRTLAWTPENREENFVDNISEMRPLWYIKKVTDERNLKENIEKEDANGNDYEFYDAVFIPDADIGFSWETIEALKNFAEYGRLIVAGDTLYNNQDTTNDNASNFTEVFGIYNFNDDPTGHDIRQQDRSSLESDIESQSDPDFFNGLKMYAQPINAKSNLDHPLLYGFTPIDNLGYEGDYVYTYDDYVDTGEVSQINNIEEHDSTQNDADYDTSTAKVLTNWGHYPEDQTLDLCGLITNDTTPNKSAGRAVFIGANIVQNVMDKNKSSYKWLRLTANSISGSEGYELFHDPITLSLWRGEGIE